MKRTFFGIITAVFALLVLTGCVKKANEASEKEPQSTPAPTEAVKSDDTVASSDVVPSDIAASDTTDSDEAMEISELELLEGSFIRVTDKKATVLTFNTKKGMCMRSAGGKATYGKFTLKNDVLDIEGVGVYKLKISKKTLSLTKEGAKKAAKFNRITARAKSVKKDSLVGSWSAAVKAMSDGSELVFVFDLNKNSTCNIGMTDANDSSQAKAMWSVKKGVLTLDNGGDSSKSKLTYTVYLVSDSVLVVDMNGYLITMQNA